MKRGAIGKKILLERCEGGWGWGVSSGEGRGDSRLGPPSLDQGGPQQIRDLSKAPYRVVITPRETEKIPTLGCKRKGAFAVITRKEKG